MVSLTAFGVGLFSLVFTFNQGKNKEIKNLIFYNLFESSIKTKSKTMTTIKG